MTDPLDPDTPYMTPAAVRAAVSGLTDTNKFDDDLLTELIARFEELVEGELGRGFTPRTTTETVTVDRGPILFSHPDVTEITAISYDEGDAPDLSDLEIVDGYSLEFTPYGSRLWPCRRRVTVSYTYGLPSPPPSILGACREFVRAEAIAAKGELPRNVTGERTDLGWIPEPTADIGRGRPTRWTVVNEAINQARKIYGDRLPGVA